MGIDKKRWDAIGLVIESLFKKKTTSPAAAHLRDMLIDCRNHIHALETAQENQMKIYDNTEPLKREIEQNKETIKTISQEVEVRKRIQHELRAIILLAINPE